MKLRKSLLLMLMALIGVTACSVDDVDDNRVIIDPSGKPMFQFDDNGVPYYYGAPNLPKEMQRDLQKEFVGYGWKWMQTNEIKEDGWVSITPYYDGVYGISPSSYYIESTNRLVRYFHSDAVNADAYWQSGYAMDITTGVLANSDALLGTVNPWSIYLKVWAAYGLNGKWYMSCVEPLCTRTADDGQMKLVWGVSYYVRMTDAELLEMQKKHTFDYSHVN